MHFFFDSYAIIELVKINPAYEKFKEVLIITNALNIAEAHYILTVYHGQEKADEAFKNLSINLLEIDKESAIAASKFRYEHKKLKLSYADCLGYCLARKKNLLFVTCDDAFESFEGVEFIK